MAFALYVGLLLAQGYRRGYAWRSWLPLVAAATLALVLGCQLVFLAPADWLAWLGGDVELARTVAGGPRSVVGGAAFSLGAVLALRRALGFRGWGVLDAFAGPLCWALAVQSVGCVLVGCCWGEPTATGTWGLLYGPGTPAYAAQLAQGLLGAGAPHALPVVPTQFYHLLLCAGTGLALHLLRRRAAGWPGGSRYLLAMGLLCLGRWGIEFWRDAAGEPLLAAPLALAGYALPGLGLQWLLLLEAAALLGGWGWLVRRGQPLGADALVPAGRTPALVGLGLLAATARLAPGTLSLPETLLLQALLLAVLLAEARTALRALGRNLPRLAGLPLSLPLAGALLLATAQAPVPQQTNAPSKTITLSGGVLGN
ncbi:MAG TPA: prolipoprotein diacylglyceryl transferase family protein [Hymenobacter sp.]|uniref:prolipoprotein diacylglyceryl transferase family protein n=1 Tax=Hymenobacter sp. TaxID=1898978 RepID=UPI002D7F2440|nr:prolipoprotein diacylglyceryl transferase family protein [Hymenobacter sp.]HET9503237.1 prolipoprotein diacylglyceryl transferase family protein [Hymenobacter sp.]